MALKTDWTVEEVKELMKQHEMKAPDILFKDYESDILRVTSSTASRTVSSKKLIEKAPKDGSWIMAEGAGGRAEVSWSKYHTNWVNRDGMRVTPIYWIDNVLPEIEDKVPEEWGTW